MTQVTQKMQLERVTPGSYLYKAVDDAGNLLDVRSATVANVYIRKSGMNGVSPKVITLTLEW